MRITPMRACALLLVGLCVACSPPASPDPVSDAALPVGGASWVAGDRASPSAGRIVVGLMVKRRASRRLADLVPKERLDTYLRELPDAEMTEKDIPEPWIAQPRLRWRAWGRHARYFGKLQKRFREEHNVDVEFREVLSHECAGLPVVLLSERAVTDVEKDDIEALRADGVHVHRLRNIRVAEESVTPRDIARVAIRQALKSSRHVYGLSADPFDLQPRREGERIHFDPALAGTKIHLEDARGHTVHEGTAGANGSVSLFAPDPGLNPYAHHVVATYETKDVTLRRAWPVERLVGTIKRELFTGAHTELGGVLAVRIRTTMTHDGSPAPARSGQLVLRRKRAIAAASYTTDAHGLAHVRLQIPGDVETGSAVLSWEGQRKTVQISSDMRLSVVTDRGLYKEDDTVHVRVMAHRSSDGRPVAAKKIKLRLGDMRREVTTSAHGIASHTFELTDARVGGWEVKARCAGAEARAKLRVKAFERPTFLVDVEPASLNLMPGETAPVTINARYVNGTPLVGGMVITDEQGKATVDGRIENTDLAGIAHGKIRAKNESGSGQVTITIKDVEGRRVNVDVPVRVAKDEPSLEVTPVSDVAVGVPATFAVKGPGPGAARITVDGTTRIIELDAEGRGQVRITPMQEIVELDASMTGVKPLSSRMVAESVEVEANGRRRMVFALERRALRAGEPVRGVLRGLPGRVRIDVWRGATPVYMTAVDAATGTDEIEIPTDASMAGVLTIFVTHESKEAVAARRTVFVTRGRALKVTAQPQQSEHGAGGTAHLDVTITDRDGKPTSAVLGYYGIDEALLALTPMTDGDEAVFDVADFGTEGLRKDAYRVEAGGFLNAEAFAMRMGDFGHAVRHTKKLPIYITQLPTLRKEANEIRRSANELRMRVLEKQYVGAWKDIDILELVTTSSYREALHWLVGRGAMETSMLWDAWGTPYSLWTDQRARHVHWVSAGPDRRFDTRDDIVRVWYQPSLYDRLPVRIRHFHTFIYDTLRELGPRRARPVEREWDEDMEETEIVTEEPVIKDAEIGDFVETDNDLPFEESMGDAAGLTDAIFAGSDAPFEGPATNGTIGIGGGAGGAFRGRGGSRDMSVSAGGGRKYMPPPIYVRKDFDPTLCFVPEAIVGPDGRTTLTVPLKDSITTWRMRLVASNADGAVGVGRGSIRVTQPVHAQPWLSPHLTVGDVVTVPVAVRNERGVAVTARVQMTPGPQLRQLADPIQKVEIAAGATGRVTFELRAVKPGTSRVRISVDTGLHQDEQERLIQVHRDRRKIVAVASGYVTGDALFDTDMGAPGPGDLTLELCPTPLAEVISGFDGLIRCPHG